MIYAVFVGAVWHRELKLRHVYPVLLEATLATSVIMLIICCAAALAWRTAVASDAESIFLGRLETMYGVGQTGEMRGGFSGSVGFVLD